MTLKGSRETYLPVDTARNDQDLTSGLGATIDSLTIGKWTVVSRATGVVRVVMIGAILGPTLLGNSYQLTNSLPNLVYYGFLAGSLFSTVLVPAIVGHMDRGDRAATARVAGGFLGVALVALTLAAPVAVVLLPQALRVVGVGANGASISAQVSLSRWLVLMVMPQVLGYAIIGTSAAAMNARRRFALAAAAPALENVAIIGVLLLVGLLFSSEDTRGAVPSGELILLGLGSTAAVGVHAALQWWGAHRCGVTLRPLAGWRDPEVLGVVRRALPSLAQSGLLALQVLTLLLVASRVPGGTVAMQIALNFYALPIALAATPVALSLLPRLSRLHYHRRDAEFCDTYVRGLGLVLFLTIPAVCGYLVLARPLAHVVAVGQMATPAAISMVAWTLTAIAVGAVGQSLFFVATQATYATGDTHTSLVAMIWQALVCVGLCTLTLGLKGVAVLVVAASAYSVANLIGATILLIRLRRRLTDGNERLRHSLLRILIGSVVMIGPTAVTANLVTHYMPGRLGWTVGLAVAGLLGLAVFAIVQGILRSPELSWVVRSVLGRGRGLPSLRGEPG
ncbi:MAG: putative peptidoglycan lipid flippase [Nocardioidaceae bacterium]|nr:putative peptidoglycan lipid flippase [Nocardioidaceae bacterium]